MTPADRKTLAAIIVADQRAQWDHIRAECADTVSRGTPYVIHVEGTTHTVRSTSQLARITRHDRAWLAPWWPEDRSH